MIEPRPYQKEAIETVLQKWSEGINKQMICLPTGAGKTIVFGLLAQKINRRTLVIAHRDELITQAVEKMLFIDSDADIGILKAKETSGLNHKICVASIQTARNYHRELRECNFKLIICDEAHHASAASYQRLFKALDFNTKNPEKLLFGCTATAYRSDEKSLEQVFQEITYQKSITEMIREGYLCDIKGISIGTDTNIKKIHTQNGDYAVGELETVVDIPYRNNLIVEGYMKHTPGKKAVAFAVSVRHAQHIAEAFRKNGIKCETIWGTMEEKERKRTLARFKAGEFNVLSNCLILTEGFDAPEIEVILMSRPTKNKGLYIQCVGRGLRLHPNKEKCILLDFVDIARKHDLCNINTLTDHKFPIDPDDTLLEAIIKNENEEEEKKPRQAVLQEKSQEVDLFGRSRFIWVEMEDIFRLGLWSGTYIYCVKTSEQTEDGGKKYETILIEEDGTAKKLTKNPMQIDYAQGVAEEYARKTTPSYLLERTSRWRFAPASQKQIDTLNRMEVEYPNGITKGDAQLLLDKVLNPPATIKQLNLIKKNQWHPIPELLTKKQAMTVISSYMGN